MQAMTDVAAVASDEADVERALSIAYSLFRNRRQWLAKQQRVAIFERTAELIGSRRKVIALHTAREGGKPLKDSLAEVDRGIDGIHSCIEVLRTKAGRVIPMDVNATSADRVAFTQHEPTGVVMVVSAFDHPFDLVVHQVAPAVAVGAPVIIKSGLKIALSCKALVDLLYRAGLPEGWAQMVLPRDEELASRMAADPRVGFVTFIGSAAVGWMRRSKLGPDTRRALQHRGIVPVIVAHDADLDIALPRIAHVGFCHAGRACTSVQRVFCARPIAAEVAAGLGSIGEKMSIGGPVLGSTDNSPLISSTEADRVARWVNEAVSGGAKLVGGGDRLAQRRYANAVLLDPPLGPAVSRKALFGAVVCVYGYDDLNTAIALANDPEDSFQAAVFTRDLDTAMHCYRNLDGTAIMINETTLFRDDWGAFAGAPLSGHGAGGIPDMMHAMQREKVMVWRSGKLA